MEAFVFVLVASFGTPAHTRTHPAFQATMQQLLCAWRWCSNLDMELVCMRAVVARYVSATITHGCCSGSVAGTLGMLQPLHAFLGYCNAQACY